MSEPACHPGPAPTPAAETPAEARRAKTAARLVWVGFAVLFVLHHDFWFWNDTTLVFGFLPIGLAWHAGYSIAAGGLWLWAVQSAWPRMVDEVAEQYRDSQD